MQSVDEVLAAIQQNVETLPVENVPLPDAWGHVLARSVTMTQDSPAFDRSQLDGFAVVASDVRVGGLLEVSGQVNAGNAVSKLGGPGTCLAINTGAPMPMGADAVLMVEHTEKVSEGNPGIFIRAKKLVSVGHGVQKRGSDARTGETVLQAGCRLWAQQLAICAAAGVVAPPTPGSAVGISEVSPSPLQTLSLGLPIRRLRAALLTTGDELVDPATTPAAGQIRNSNHPMLSALLQQLGSVRVGDGLLDLGTCPDDAGRMRTLLAEGLERADLLVVSGGMSMGTKDLVPPLLKELGVQFFVEKVRMKPGKPFIFGARKRDGGGGVAYVVGLPGNPVSAFVTFQRFVREIMGRLVGERMEGRIVEAEVGAALEANGDREFYMPCALRRRAAVTIAEPLRWKGSANLFALAEADGLIVRPVGALPADIGARVSILLLR